MCLDPLAFCYSLNRWKNPRIPRKPLPALLVCYPSPPIPNANSTRHHLVLSCSEHGSTVSSAASRSTQRTRRLLTRPPLCPMSSDPHKQGQYPPPQWESQPPRGAYPIPQQVLNYRVRKLCALWSGDGPRRHSLILMKGPPNPQAYQQHPSTSSSGDMVTLPPPQHQQHQDMYRLPAYDMYQGHPQDPRGGPPQHMSLGHPAPRQRTAIACRYCRRRKVS